MFEGHPDQHFGAVSYSQQGEDILICGLFKMLGVDCPTYLDLGAHHPTIISNTRLLYERGSAGVNIEANSLLIDAFKLERPRDVTLCLGVSALPGEMTLYMYSDTSGRNTMSEAEVLSLKGRLHVHREIRVQTKSLDQIVFEHCEGKFPDFLNCDIEGLDVSVLESSRLIAKLSSAPMVICVECHTAEDRQQMKRVLFNRGFVLHCRMLENLIFVRQDVAQSLL